MKRKINQYKEAYYDALGKTSKGWHENESVKMVELTLRKLLEEGKIKKIGTYKDARYMRRF